MKIETVHEGWLQLRTGKRLIAEVWQVHTNDATKSARKGWAWAVAPYTRQEIHWSPTKEDALNAAKQAAGVAA